jgi:cullin-associated NEDD8-dissociated protein 1
VPLVLQQCSPAKARGDAEMCEACLQAFDSFVLRCPKEVTTFQQEIARTALQYISYDPNYADADDDEEMEDEDEDMEEDEDDAEYSDDDDVSWKVRRAAAKVLSAIIISRPDKLPELFPEVAPVRPAAAKTAGPPPPPRALAVAPRAAPHATSRRARRPPPPPATPLLHTTRRC